MSYARSEGVMVLFAEKDERPHTARSSITCRHQQRWQGWRWRNWEKVTRHAFDDRTTLVCTLQQHNNDEHNNAFECVSSLMGL